MEGTAATILSIQFQIRGCRDGLGLRLLNGPADRSLAMAVEASDKTTAIIMDRNGNYVGFGSAMIAEDVWRVTTAKAPGTASASGFGFPNGQANESFRLADENHHQTCCCKLNL